MAAASAIIISAAKAAVSEGEAIVEGALKDLPRRPKSVPLLPSRPADSLLTIEQRVATIMQYDRQNRLIPAAVALVELQRWYEASAKTAFAKGERTWLEFVAKRIPLDPARIRDLMGRVLSRGGLMRCEDCGTASICLCGCGASYQPEHPAAMPSQQPTRKVSALDRATAAIKTSPEKSNRAIAAEIGVSHQVVGRARRQIKEAAGDGPVDGPVARVGRDGKRRKLPTAADDDDDTQDSYRIAYLVRADQAGWMAFYDEGPVDDEILASAAYARDQWAKLYDRLQTWRNAHGTRKQQTPPSAARF